MPRLFDPLTLRGITLKNRIMMPAMCQYSAGTDGLANDWHFVHYPTRAVGGVGLILTEATAVESRGRISDADLGIWEDRQVEGLARIAALCHERGAKVGVQLAHAGRKSFSRQKGFYSEEIVAPSALPFDQDWKTPRALNLDEIDGIVASWQKAAARVREAGFDVIELHAAHGYLINQFLSPLINHRKDEYGGLLANRLRFFHRVVDAVRKEWPESQPLFVRLSCAEYAPGGIDLEQTVEIARTLSERGVDLVDCSSGAAVPVTVSAWPGYQVPFAERIKREAGIRTAAVGIITTPDLAEEIIRNERADLAAVGRELLRHPYWPLDAAAVLGVDLEWPVQYLRAKR